jgi:hypothetical protein
MKRVIMHAALGPKALGLLALGLLAAAALSCGGGGKYNYDVKYSPLKAEKPYYEDAEDINYVEIKADPLKYRGAKLSWFGTVQDIKKGGDGAITVLLQYRTHQERHLCDDQLVKSTCRVTVSEKTHGTFTTTFKPSSEDMEGKTRINFKSLILIYGTPTGDYDDEGGPILTCDFYRHWPPGTYVTTAAAKVMRQ